MRFNPRYKSIATLGLLVGLTGCSALQKNELEGRTSLAQKEKNFWNRLPFVGDRENDQPVAYPNPVKMAATWSSDTLTQSGRTPTRGFGGRLFFFDEKSHAVPVDGTLVVHGFDERGKEKESVKRFEFTPEQFTKHYSQSDLGASYSVWIPWDAIGGNQKEIALVASFVTAEGKTVQSSPTKVILPGVAEDPEKRLQARMSPDYHAWKLASANVRPPRSGLTTTTIQRAKPGWRRDGFPQETSGSLIAGATSARSADVKMNRTPSRSLILPASATLPSKR